MILGITSALKFGLKNKIIKTKEFQKIINHIVKMKLAFKHKKLFFIKKLKFNIIIYDEG